MPELSEKDLEEQVAASEKSIVRPQLSEKELEEPLAASEKSPVLPQLSEKELEEQLAAEAKCLVLPEFSEKEIEEQIATAKSLVRPQLSEKEIEEQLAASEKSIVLHQFSEKEIEEQLAAAAKSPVLPQFSEKEIEEQIAAAAKSPVLPQFSEKEIEEQIAAVNSPVLPQFSEKEIEEQIAVAAKSPVLPQFSEKEIEEQIAAVNSPVLPQFSEKEIEEQLAAAAKSLVQHQYSEKELKEPLAASEKCIVLYQSSEKEIEEQLAASEKSLVLHQFSEKELEEQLAASEKSLVLHQFSEKGLEEPLASAAKSPVLPQLSEKELEEQLAAAAKILVLPLPSVDELLPLLDQIEALLSKVEHPSAKSMQYSFSPLIKALAMDDLLKHSDVEVKIGVTFCLSEITRITAPYAPYDDEKMKDVFQLIVSSFENLSDIGSRSYEKIAIILETVAKVRSSVIMLDLECEQMIIQMFQHFLKAIREDHGDTIFTYMETIMTLVLEESEDIYPELLAPILATLKRNNEAAMPIAKKLAERVLQNSAVKLRPYLREAVKSLDTSLDDYSEVVSCLCGGNTDTVGRSIESIIHDQPVSVVSKKDDGSSLRKEAGKKSGRGCAESTSGKEVRRSTAREDHGKGIVTSRKSPLKSSKNKGTQEETPKTSKKRKQTPGKEKASETLEYDESLVGAKVKVWWREDLFYEGEIASFDSVKKKHKVAYTVGDEEVLNLQKERWEFIGGDMVSDGDQEVEHSSLYTTSDMNMRKKGNANSETSSKRQKVEGSPKRKPIYTAPKCGSKSKDDGKAEGSKSKDNYLKPGKKSKDDSSIKSKDQSQKLGGKGRVDIGNASGRAIAEGAKASRYSKQDCQWSSKSKGKTPQSFRDTRVTKPGSSKVKGKRVESEEFVSMSDDGFASDSEADHTEKTERRFSLWKEVGKKSGRGRPTSDRRFSAREEDHGKDIGTSWKSPLISTKNKGTLHEETPKIKQTPGKEKEDIHLLLRAIEDSSRNYVSGEASPKEDIHSLPWAENKNSGSTSESTSIRDAMEILKNIPGIAPASELWNYACNLLSQKDMREVFANQPSHGSRLSWLGFNYDQFKRNK